MTKRLISLMLCAVMLVTVCGCASLLEGDHLDISVHEEEPDAANTDTVLAVTDFDELTEAVLSLVKKRQETGVIRFFNYDGDVGSDVEQACLDVSYNTPMGMYAVYYMSNTINRIVSYYDAEITITYKRSKSQIDSIVTAATLSSVKLKISGAMRDYTGYLAIDTTVSDFTKDDLVGYIEELYYGNPESFVILPELKINLYPEEGAERIVEMTFEYPYTTYTLDIMKDEAREAAGRMAESVRGVGDGEILLSLCQQLMGTAEYDAETAESGETDKQNASYTAYGALVGQMAVGEGYATAYKMLCDIIGLGCMVVVGEYNGSAHTWNLVELDGQYYHVDVSMCDREGIETSFLMNDQTIGNAYSWDGEQYPAATGDLTYADIVS